MLMYEINVLLVCMLLSIVHCMLLSIVHCIIAGTNLNLIQTSESDGNLATRDWNFSGNSGTSAASKESRSNQFKINTMRNMFNNARATVVQAAARLLRRWWLPISLVLSCIFSRQLWLPPVMSTIEWAAQHLPDISACIFVCLAAASAPCWRIPTQIRAWAARCTHPISSCDRGRD